MIEIWLVLKNNEFCRYLYMDGTTLKKILIESKGEKYLIIILIIYYSILFIMYLRYIKYQKNTLNK